METQTTMYTTFFLASIGLCAALGTDDAGFSATIQLELSPRSVIPGQAVQLVVRVRNTTGYDLPFQGFGFGYHLPVIEYRRPDGAWRRLRRWTASDSDYRPKPTILPKDGEISGRVFLLQDPLARVGIEAPGTYELRGILPVQAVNQGTGEVSEVSWTSTPISLDVRSPNETELSAYRELAKWENDRQRQSGKVDPAQAREQEIDFFQRFLEKHDGSVYADQVRLDLAENLLHVLDDLHPSREMGRTEAARQARAILAPKLVAVLQALRSRGGLYERFGVSELASVQSSLPEVYDLEAARQAADRWLQLEPDNKDAQRRHTEVLEELSRATSTRPASVPAAATQSSTDAIVVPKSGACRESHGS